MFYFATPLVGARFFETKCMCKKKTPLLLEAVSAMKMAENKVLLWTDDEVQLLLRVTLNYKTTECQENNDWESCRSTYVKITWSSIWLMGKQMEKISLTRKPP